LIVYTVQSIRAVFHKPFTPALFFFGGVSFDTVTLTRIDRLSDNLILLGYLGLLGVLIVRLGRADRASTTTEGVPLSAVATLMERTRPYHPMAIQFLLGGLFSAYAIFYSRSASFTSTAVFFALLVGLLVGNEFLHDQVSNFRLMLALYALAAASFLTFFLPVITGVMTTAMFLAGAVLSAGLAVAMVRLVYKGSLYSPWEPMRTALPALLVVGTLVAFYFLNWIPPVPLSMSFGGVYHKVVRSGDAYELTFERPPWYRFWKRNDDPFRGQEGVHCFTAIFAPVDLRAEIYHHWEHRAAEGPNAGRFVTTDRIPLAIVGGRDGGYRAFTAKERVAPGDWRVNAETKQGRIIGRVSFRVEVATEPLAFKTIFY
jgi:hypothetical protein